MKPNRIFAIFASVVLLSAGPSWAQSTGASPADPNNERNQRPAPSNTQPADPAADSNPAARVPTDPGDAASAEREEGGASGGTGSSSGEEGSDVIIVPENAPPY